MPPFCNGPAMAGKGGHAKSPMNEPDDKARIQDSASVWTDGSQQSFEQPGESTGPASVWKYGYGLDFKQQPDNKAKSQRASGSTATASTSSSSRTTRPRPSERLEVRLQPRLQALRPRLLQAAAGQHGQGPASVWKYGYGLDFCKQQPDNKAKAQRAFGSTATASTSSSSRPRLSERLEARLRPQQPDNKAKFQRASGSTATASTSSSIRMKRPGPSERLEVRLQLRLLQAQGQGSAKVWKHGYGLSSRTTRPSSSERLEVRTATASTAAGRKGQGPASVRHFFKQKPNNDKARCASGSTATPRLLPAAVRRQGKRPAQDGCDFFKQRPDHKAKAQ